MADFADLLQQVVHVDFEQDHPDECAIPELEPLALKHLAGLTVPIEDAAVEFPFFEALRDGWQDEDDGRIATTVAVQTLDGYTFLTDYYGTTWDLVLWHEGELARLPTTELGDAAQAALENFDSEIASGLAPTYGVFWPVDQAEGDEQLERWALLVRGLPVIPARVHTLAGFAWVGDANTAEGYAVAEAFIRVGYAPPAGLLPLPTRPAGWHQRTVALALWRSVRRVAEDCKTQLVQLESALEITADEERVLLP